MIAFRPHHDTATARLSSAPRCD